MTEHVVFPPHRFTRNNVELHADPRYMGPAGVSIAPAGTWTHLWLDHDRISLKKTDHKVGVTKSGKKFSRYTPHSQLTFNFTPRLRVFYSYRRRGVRVINDITARTLGMGSDREVRPHLLDRAPFLSEIPQPDYVVGGRNGYAMHINAWVWQRIAYPVLREAPHWDAVTGMSQALRQRDLQGFVRVGFGNGRYRKDLVKAIASAKSLNGTWLAHELRTTFPIDWLIPIIPSVRNSYEEMRHIKSFMRALPASNARRLLMALEGDLPAFAVSDTLRSWSQILRLNPDYTLGDYRFTNWNDAHDHLSREAGKVERADQKIKPTSLGKRFDGKSQDGITLVHPKSTWELIDWGRDMHNCIGGYDHAALSGSSVLFAVMRGDRMIGNMEMTPKGSIRQLVGDYNRPLPEEDQRIVRELVGVTPVQYDAEANYPF